MNIKKWFFVIFALYIAGYLSHALYLGKTVFGDGIFYYSWVRSIVVDHGIKFSENKYTVGPAIVWSPAVISTYLLRRGTGYEFPYQFFVGLTSVLSALAGLVLMFRLLTRFYSITISLLTTLSIAFATNLFFYGSLDPVNSHALSFFVAIFFLNVLFTEKKQWFFIGLSLGFIGLMRTQDLIYGLALIPHWKSSNKSALLGGILIGLAPQLFAWQALYGKFWTSPYLSQQEGFDVFRPHISEILFSYRSGLFFWTPILALGLVGLFVSKFNRWLKAIVFTQIYLVSTWSTWWQGASYSGRMFVSVLPLFALGLAHLYQWLWQKGWREFYFFYVFIVPLSLLNMLLIIYFLLIT